MKKEDNVIKIKDYSELVEFIGEKFDDAHKELSGIKGDVGGIKTKLGHIENQMITKSYLDDKFTDLKGGDIVKLRKIDRKVGIHTEALKRKKILGHKEVKELDELAVFSLA